MRSVVTLAFAAIALAFGAGAAAAQTQPADSAATAAAHADSSHETSPSTGRRPRRNANQLTAEEIDAVHESSVYGVIARLRPRWLRNGRSADIRGPEPVEIQVYRNGQSLGNLESLKQIVPTDVAMLQWFDPMASRARFGNRAENGAIVIIDKP